MPFDNPTLNPIIERLRWGWSRVKRGWLQGKQYRRNGRYPLVCAQGAVFVDDNGKALDDMTKVYPGDVSIGTRAEEKLEQAAELLCRCEHMPTPSYNDHHERTIDDMKDLFDVAEDLVWRELQRKN